MKKISVGLIKYDMTEKSGGDRVAANLASALSEDFSVHLISINGKDEPPYFSFNEKVKYAPLLKGHERIRKTMLSGTLALRKYLGANKIDLLMSIGGNVNFFLAFGAPKSIKKVFCEHINLESALLSKSDSLMRKLGVKIADKIITLTEKDKNAYERRFSLSGERVEAIPNWIDPVLLHCEGEYEISSKKIITVGRLCEQKGLDYLITVAKKVLGEAPDWKWEIWGDGPLKDELLREIEKNSLQDKLTLMGVSDKIYDEYRKYAIYCMTSRTEGLPMVLLEAKTRALPIVSFDCSTGPSDIVEDGVNGYLIETFDTDKMAEKLLTLMNDDKLRKDFSLHAKDNLSLFSKEEIVSRWISLIKQLTSK